MFFARFNKFLKYFGKGYGNRLTVIYILAFITSLFEFLSIALVFPFIMIFINPGRVATLAPAIYIREHYGIVETDKLILIIGGMIAAGIIIKNMISIFMIYLQNKIISEWGLKIKKEILGYYLYSPYEADLRRGKVNTVGRITKNIDDVMQFYIFKFISFISNSFVIAFIFIILFTILPVHTIIAITFFSIAGLIQSSFFQKWADRLATKKFKLTDGPYNSAINNLNRIKDIKINGCQKYFYNLFSSISKKIIPYDEKLSLIPLMPQYIIEIIFIFTMIILCLGILSKYGQSPDMVIINMGIIAIAIYRLVPQIYKNQIYLNYINIHTKSIEELFATYEEFKKYEYAQNKDSVEKIPFNDKISLSHISYSYDTKSNALFNVSVDIKKGEFIGIVGLSGAGKSTFVDCLLGLLAYDGDISVDDTLLNVENINSFRNIIGYVPQKVSTVEGDIYSNVAWGIDRKDIDKDRVDEVLKTAQLYDQLKQTENGLGLELKQDGTGLSGGQMQRVGIARALYRNPEIIILDEATSNLDVKIENKLTEVISDIKGKKTVIAIAHRLSTLLNCDRIIYLADGKLVDVGTFKELSEKHQDFEEIIKLSRIKLEDED